MSNTTRPRQGELFAPPPPQRPPAQKPEPTLAEWSAICPLCSKYIAKNHSWITRLPYPIEPRCTPDRRRSLDDKGYYHARGTQIYPAPKKYCHERCWSKHQRPPRYEALHLFDDFDGYPFYELIDRRDDNLHYLYRLYSDDGRLLYVGMTYDVEQRLGQHYSTKPWQQMREVYRLTVQEYPTRQAVVEAEHRAIAAENPLWNIAT